MKRSDCMQALKQAREILDKEELLNSTICTEYQELSQRLTDFKPKILLVGQFSAGKSALLNTFLNSEEILPENVTPETAIATELCYSEVDGVFRVYKDGTKQLVTRSIIQNLSPEDCKKYIYLLPNKRLKNLKDLIIVDMPGFDSGIEAHNHALLQYEHEAAAYIFVVDIKGGTLSASSKNFLMELLDYTNNIRFVLTKSDQLPASKIEEVKNEFESIILSIFGKSIPITVTSKFDLSAPEKLMNLFQSFTSDKLFLDKMGPSINQFLLQGQKLLVIKKETLLFDDYEFQCEITKREQSLKNFQRELIQRKVELHSQMQLKYVPQIISDIREALFNQSDYLVHEAMTGDQEVFSLAVSNILRPALKKSYEQNLEENLGRFCADILSTLSEEQALDMNELTGKVTDGLKATKKIAQIGMNFSKVYGYKKIYKVFSTVFAITTNVIAPWIELVIVFLPDILGVMQSIFGETKEETIKKMIERKVIPQIIDNLRPHIEKTAENLEDETVDKLEQQYKNKIQNENMALEQLRKEKNRQQENISRQKQRLIEEIAVLAQAATDIDTALMAI